MYTQQQQDSCLEFGESVTGGSRTTALPRPEHLTRWNTTAHTHTRTSIFTGKRLIKPIKTTTSHALYCHRFEPADLEWNFECKKIYIKNSLAHNRTIFGKKWFFYIGKPALNWSKVSTLCAFLYNASSKTDLCTVIFEEIFI